MEKSSIPYLENFEEFCKVNDISSDSSSSYADYIVAAYKHLCPLVRFEYEGQEYDARDLFDNLDRFIKNDSGRKLVIFLFEVLSNIKFDELPPNSISKKYFSNIKTALRWFLSYMIVVCEDKIIISKNNKESHAVFGSFNQEVAKTILEDLKKRYPLTKSIFTKSDLIKIFTARMLTQDRVKGNYAVELPIRKISGEITYHKKQKTLAKDTTTLSQWIKDFLPEKVKFIVSVDGKEFVFLKDITSLKIADDGEVTVKVGKKDLLVYTEVYENKESKGYKSFGDLAELRKKPTEIRNLALDHDTPIFKVLKNNAGKLIVLKKFNNLKDEHLNPEECKRLFEEFIELHNDVAFTIMDQKENVKKGKNE